MDGTERGFEKIAEWWGLGERDPLRDASLDDKAKMIGLSCRLGMMFGRDKAGEMDWLADGNVFERIREGRIDGVIADLDRQGNVF